MNDYTHLANLAWKILYKEDREEIPDPNKPENLPYLKAKKKQKAEALEILISGPGKILFENWHEKIKRLNLGMLFTPKSQLCNCSVCETIREIKATLEIWLEAEQILVENKKKEI